MRPAEWVLLAFLGFLAFKLVLAPQIVMTPEQPPRELAAGMLAVVSLQLLMRFRALAWPDEIDPRWITRHRIFLGFAALPLLLEIADLLGYEWSAGEGEGDLLWRVMGTGVGVLIRVILVATPSLLAWLALGVHLKRHAGLRPAAMPAAVGSEVIRILRDWAPPLVMIFSYRLMGLVLNGQPSTADRDPQLIALDRLICLGHDPVQWLQSHSSTLLLEWMTFVYGFYFALYPLCFGALYLLPDPRGFREVSLAICLALAIGYVGYTLVPAQGPAIAEHLIPNVNNYQFRAMTSRIEQARIQRDAFPSLHTATSLTLLWAVSRHRRRLFAVLAPIVVSIPIACVYLGWHYLSDVIAGVVLAAVVTTIAPRWLGGPVPTPPQTI